MRDGRATQFAAIPASVAAFHLAFVPDCALYVSAPTLASHDPVYRVTPTVSCEPSSTAWRPQAWPSTAMGRLYVADAVAGGSAIYRVRPDRPSERERVITGGALLGLAFDPRGGLVVASSDTAYRLDVGLRGLLLLTPTA